MSVLRHNTAHPYRIVVFFDDNPKVLHKLLNGIRVFNPEKSFKRATCWPGSVAAKCWSCRIGWPGAVGTMPVTMLFWEKSPAFSPLWKPMHLQPIFADCPFHGQGISDQLFEQGLCLPSGSNLEEADFSRIFEILAQILLI